MKEVKQKLHSLEKADQSLAENVDKLSQAIHELTLQLAVTSTEQKAINEKLANSQIVYNEKIMASLDMIAKSVYHNTDNIKELDVKVRRLEDWRIKIATLSGAFGAAVALFAKHILEGVFK